MAPHASQSAGTGLLPVIKPMFATPGVLPRADAEYGFEVKWDGARIGIQVPAGGPLRLLSRSGLDVTATFPELAPLADGLHGRSAILDGEVVALDARGLPDLARLRRRLNVHNPRRAATLVMDVPVHLVLFDLLYIDGRMCTSRPYRERRAALTRLGLVSPRWSTPTHSEGQGPLALEQTLANGLGGLVCKRLDSPYRPGVRSPEWIKITRSATLDLADGR
ncbi:hypothetical protein [Embleya sp. NBC_00896]|uniref:ATP-dependent DNA ligase n=1 Tax=Embleya sp. NBC_00896 TaxID=2975961 RepID=UPI002F90C874|nr:hypothetical protein OG928_39040 [Embleya sp. NBC_00896]